MNVYEKQTNILFILFLILVDILKLNDLWNENFHRRLYNHLKKPYYNKTKIPYIKYLTNMLTADDINYYFVLLQRYNKTKCLQNINKTLSKLLSGLYSKKCSYYYNDFNNEDKLKLDKIGNKMLPKLEKIIGKKLVLCNSDFRAVILVYNGKDTEFTWHYDTEDTHCYRTIILLHKNGNIPKFTYIDKFGNKIVAPIENIGDGIVFQGTKTFHSLQNVGTTDYNMERIVIGFQYIEYGITDNHKSLCSELRSKSVIETIKILTPNIILFFVLSRLIYCILKYNKLELNISTHSLILVVLLLVLLNTELGIDIRLNLKYFIFLILTTMNINISLLVLLYVNISSKLF
jgi:hypothetical protein